jgi:hypothetical protein
VDHAAARLIGQLVDVFVAHPRYQRLNRSISDALMIAVEPSGTSG